MGLKCGIVGLPNVGKSSILKALTNANPKIAGYPFTTLEPHLGDLYGFVLADIPGLIEGASEGKGLGHKFLRHVSRTKMILHLISLEYEDALPQYQVIQNELEKFDPKLLEKEEWIILTKTDLVSEEKVSEAVKKMTGTGKTVYAVSAETGNGVKELRDGLIVYLRKTESEAPKTTDLSE